MTRLRSSLGTVALVCWVAAPSAAGNLETVGMLYAAFGEGDIPTILSKLDEDVAWDHGYEGTSIATMVPRHGPDGVLEFFQALGGLEFRKFEVMNMLEGGNQVAAVIDVELVGRETGLTFADQELHLWTFGEEGTVVAFRHFLDMEEFGAILPQ